MPFSISISSFVSTNCIPEKPKGIPAILNSVVGNSWIIFASRFSKYNFFKAISKETPPILDPSNASYEEPTLEEIIKQLLSDSEQSQEEASGDDYESPDDVDYRGDFKPEMVQLLSQMRGQPEAGDEDGSENTQGMTIEQICRMLVKPKVVR